jgi:hypothetical protein
MITKKQAPKKRVKVQTMLSLEPEQKKQVERLSKATRIPQQVLLREGVDMLIKRYKRKGDI